MAWGSIKVVLSVGAVMSGAGRDVILDAETECVWIPSTEKERLFLDGELAAELAFAFGHAATCCASTPALSRGVELALGFIASTLRGARIGNACQPMPGDAEQRKSQ